MIWRIAATHLLMRLGQSSACGSVAFGRTENLRPVALQPAPMVLFTLKALVGYIWSPGESRSHARQPRVATVTHCEEGLGRWLIFGRSRGETETCCDAVGSTATSRQNPSYHPRRLLHPMSAEPASHPSPLLAWHLGQAWPSSVQGLVGTALSLHITAARCKATSSI